MTNRKRTPRRKTRITYEGLSFLMILAFIVLGSILRQINLLVLLSGLMIAPFFFNWRISRKMLESVVFSRHLPAWAHARTRFVVSWKAHNHRKSLPAWEIRIDDQVRPVSKSGMETVRAGVVIHQVNASQSGTGQYTCTISGRGIYEFGSAIAHSAFPVGLVRTSIPLPETQRLIVAPELVRLKQNWLAATRSSARMQQDSSDRRNGQSHEGFFALRNWQAGDSRRLVHWRSSAKRGELLVRQGVDPDSLQTTILFDFGVDPSQSAITESTELLASIAATIICQQAGSQNGKQPLLAIRGDRSSGSPVQPGARTVPALLECLATVQSATTTGVFDALKNQSGRRVGVNRQIVLSQRSFSAACDAEKVGESVNALSSRLTWVDVTQQSLLMANPAPPDTGGEFMEAVPAESATELAGQR